MNDDIDVEGEIGFAPAVHATGADASGSTATPAAATATTARAARRRRAGVRRRIGSAVTLIAALGAMGTAYAAFATSSGAESTAANADKIAQGRQIYARNCITCHGQNLNGITAQGPSLLGVGGAAVYFQVITGRMPVARQGSQVARKPPKYNEEQTEALAAYVESAGGGPGIPSGDLRADVSQAGLGGQLFRLNCAQCHGATARGAALSAGKYAPSLNVATDKEIYTAMLSGPQNMPVFSDNTITPDEKRAIISYIQTLKASKDPGGAGVGRIGPVSEAIVIWVAGVGALMISILWIGARSR